MFFFVFAQDGITNPVVGEFSVGELISDVISLFIIFAFIAAFFFLLWGGFQWITSGGSPEAVDAARGRIVQALIGLVLVVAAWALFSLVGDFLGFDFTNFDLPVLGDGQTAPTPTPRTGNIPIGP